jgi:SH3-like domain-containing protein
MREGSGMPLLRRAWPALLLLAIGSGPAWPQQVAPGSLPPPRPIQPAPAQPSASPPPAPAQRQQAAPSRPQPQAAPRPAPPAQARPAQPAQRPAAQPAARPAGQAPAVGAQTPPANRRPPAAAAGVAAGAAAGAAAAGAASAATRVPEPAQPAPPPQPTVGQMSGLPLPRFASLRSDTVNMRVGPNTTFPIEWTFQRRDLPVMIIGEFQVWRRIRDVDGAEGWVHQSTLAGRRTALVRAPASAPEITLRRRPEEGAPAVARLRSGVIARIRECEASSSWCEVQAAGHRGYVKRGEIWGVTEDEEVKG